MTYIYILYHLHIKTLKYIASKNVIAEQSSIGHTLNPIVP